MKKFSANLLGLALLTALAACSPNRQQQYIPPGAADPGLNNRGAQSVSSSEQKAIREERKKLKKSKPKKKKSTSSSSSSASSKPRPSSETAEKKTVSKPKPTKKPKKSYPTASAVPGKEGFVISPYTNRVIDVRGMPSGKLVKDPDDPSDAKNFFRVP